MYEQLLQNYKSSPRRAVLRSYEKAAHWKMHKAGRWLRDRGALARQWLKKQKQRLQAPYFEQEVSLPSRNQSLHAPCTQVP